MTEPVATPNRMLGRRAPKNAPALRAARFLVPGGVPVHPQAVDNFSEVSDWGLYANDTYGDCGPVSVANQRKLITRYLTAAEQSPTQDDVFALYKASGNPNFDPANPGGPGDGGVDMQTMCEALVKVGIGGVKALGFAKVDVSNLDEVRAAVAVFGSLLLGVNLETAQQDQTNRRLWDYSPSNSWGGHAVLTGRYTSAKTGDDMAVITWADVVGTTDTFWLHQVEEAWIVIWPEHAGTVEFQAGVDVAALAADYLALTGKPFPIQPTPAPTPQPVPTPVPPVTPPVPAADADKHLAATLRPWMTHRHVGENRALQLAAKAWLAAKGL